MHRNPTVTGVTPGRHTLTERNDAARRGVCAVCGPVSFTLLPRGNGTTRYRCQTKHREYMKRFRSGNEAFRNASHDCATARKYGLERGGYQRMYEQQNGQCASCGAAPRGRLHVDHDHRTGVVRQLLCRHCNTAIGYLKDSPARALAVAAYLTRHSVPAKERN